MNRTVLRGLALSFACLIGSGSAGAAEPELIPHAQDRPPGPPLSPAEAVRKMTVPEGFQVELVASEPEIVNPVAMTIDERGRFWITESLEYPRRSAGPGRDRVKVLEDTDGDGKADKFTVFAEGLNIPSGIAVGAGGVWVANAPDILFLKDTDGDGKADVREVVVTGFGRDDTHELPNSLTWGPDGWLYGLNGVFNRSRVTQGGKTYDFTCALFRIHPTTRKFELFAEGTSNPWGVAWDSEGSAFVSACVIDHLWHLAESGYYHRQGGPYPPFTWKIESIVDYRHQKAAYCGIHYFDSDAYPEQYRGRLYMGNIHGNCINVDRLEKHGSTYQGKYEKDFLSANDAWFMPVVQKTGPDGCLYILDWYDRYHCYQDANRDPAGIDRLKGRLYRVRYGDSPRAGTFDLAQENDDRLLERLASPNVYHRDIAQRLLRERKNAATLPKLQSLILDTKSPRPARMHALWTLIGGFDLDPAFHLQLLKHEDPSFRAWGIRAAGNVGTVEPTVRDQVVAMAHDPSPVVALQVAIAANKLQGVDAPKVLKTVLARAAGDELLPRIVWKNLLPHLPTKASAWLDLAQPDDLKPGRPYFEMLPRFLERLASAHDAEAVGRTLDLLASADPSKTREGLAALARRVIDGDFPIRKLTDSGLAQRLERWRADAVLAEDAAILIAATGEPRAISVLRDWLGDSKKVEARRLQALETLILAGADGLHHVIGPALDEPRRPIGFHAGLIAALGRHDDPAIAPTLLSRYEKLGGELQPRVIELLVQRDVWAKALLDAVESKTVPAHAVNVNQIRRLTKSADPRIAARAKALWGIVREERNPQREQIVAQMRTFLRQTKGDPVAGKTAFTKVCAQCHKLFGEGQEVGPDLTSNGRNSFDQLLSNVFDPSLVIGSAYQSTQVATTDGRIVSGLKVEDSPQRVVLKLQGGKTEVIPRPEIETIQVGALSLMPENLEAQLSPREIADLFAYLMSDGPSRAPTGASRP